MWKSFLLSALIYIIGATSRPVDSLEGPLWLQKISAYSTSNYLRHLQPRLSKQREFPNGEYNIDDDYNEIHPQNNKRTLAMLARWGPFHAFGKERAPIRSAFRDEEISTQTRRGQPLRWG